MVLNKNKLTKSRTPNYRTDGFGVIICCSKYDWYLAGGALVSLVKSNPDLDVCILHDSDIPKQFFLRCKKELKFLDSRKTHNNELSTIARGWGLTKLVAFNHSPFEKFLIIDADILTINRINPSEFFQYDMVVDQSDYEYGFESIKKWFWDNDRVEDVGLKKLELQTITKNLFVSGWWFSKRGILKDDLIIKFIKISLNNPGMFFPGEMGFLNYLVIIKELKGDLMVKRFNYQKIIADYTLSQQIELFSNSNDNKFIHYAGPTKPKKQNLGKYHIEPYINYILEFMRYSNKRFNENQLFKLTDLRGEYLTSFDRLEKRAKSLIRRLYFIIRNKK